MSWKNYYARPFYLQDYESRQVFHTFQLHGGLVQEAIFTWSHGKMEAWYKTEEFGELLILLAKEVLKDDWHLEDHLQKYTAVKALLLSAAHNAADVGQQNAGPKELLQAYELLMKTYNEYIVYLWLPWGITEYLEGWFLEQLRSQYPTEAGAMYEIVAHSPKAIQMQDMCERVWQWRLHGRDAQEMKNIVEEFGYLAGYSATHQSWNADEIDAQAGEHGNEIAALKRSQSSRERAAADMHALLTRLHSEHPQLEKVAAVINEYVWLRTERIDLYKQAIMDSRPWFRRIEALFHLPFGGAVHMSTQELKALLCGEPSVLVEELQRRMQNGYVAHITTHGTTVISDVEEQKQFVTKYLGAKDWQAETEVRGQVACTGIVRGKARVMFHTKESDRMQQGEILIANMTHPDYMPAIRKAAAIVTDEGGIVCHAAVISRELQIPCVIGAQNATKVFRDGDMVEVNAKTGVVRKVL